MLSLRSLTSRSHIFIFRQLQPACTSSLTTRSLSCLSCQNYNNKYYFLDKSSSFKYLMHVRTQNTKTDVSGIESTEKLKSNNVSANEIQEKIDSNKNLNLSRAEKLKKAVKEYGSTVIVFHVGISLISLGTCYLLVSSGLDVVELLKTIGLEKWTTNSQLAMNAGTFAVAYAIHKVFAPVRIAITLGSVPFIVRYLRRIGFLKK